MRSWIMITKMINDGQKSQLFLKSQPNYLYLIQIKQGWYYHQENWNLDF